MDYYIRGATIVNEGEVFAGNVHLSKGFIREITRGEGRKETPGCTLIDAKGLHLFPGVIDDQVHFREPGLTHKGEIATESRSAVAGGVTSFMEMPNTVPNTLTQELLEKKFDRAAEVSPANYSFFMGASNDNLREVLKTDPSSVCGVKVFMGSSTGNMLVDDRKTLDGLFSECPLLIATHSEDEGLIRANLAAFREKYGDDIPIDAHPLIRSAEACYKSSSLAVELASRYGTRLHILHISTARETALFSPGAVRGKKITAEACIHHLWFSDKDYPAKGNFIKWNPAIKTESDRNALWKALDEGRLDVVCTDHAPHTIEEKQSPYLKAPSGGPLVQHSLVTMLECHHMGRITLAGIAEKMSHNVAVCFGIVKRGFIREGYHADLVLVDLDSEWMVKKSNLLYKCGWSPFEGQTFRSKVTHTFVNGYLAYDNSGKEDVGRVAEGQKGMRLMFER